MSQFPLETSLPGQSIAANQSVAVPRTRLEELMPTMVTPRIVTDQSQRLSSWFQGLFGGAAQVAGQAAGIKEQQARKIEQDVAHEMHEAKRKGEAGQPIDPTITHERILSVYHEARTDFQTEQDIQTDMMAIAEKKYPIQRGESVPAAITRLVGERTQGMPEAYQAIYARKYAKRIAPLLFRVKEQFRGEQFDSLSNAVVRGLVAARSLGDLDQAGVDRYVENQRVHGKSLGYSDSETMAPLMTAARTFAIAGDEASLALLAPHLGEVFPDDWQQLQTQAAGAARAKQNAGYQQQDEQIAAEKLAGLPASVRRERIAARYKSGAITASMAEKYEADFQRDHEAVIRESQSMNAKLITGAMALGSVPADELMGELRSRTMAYMQNPLDPAGIDPSQASALMAQIEAGQRSDASALRVGRRMKGEAIALTSGDDAAIMKGLHAQGLIDEAGKPTSAEGMALQLEKLGRVPTAVIDRISAGASADDPKLVEQAARQWNALQRIAPAAMREASGLDLTAELRLGVIAAEISRAGVSPIQIGRAAGTVAPGTTRSAIPQPGEVFDKPIKAARLDGSVSVQENPEFARVMQQAIAKAMPITQAALAGVKKEEIEMSFAGVTSPSQVGPGAVRALRYALPAYLREREHWFRDTQIDYNDVPLTYTSQFRTIATQQFAALTLAGWSPEPARREASRQAVAQLEQGFIMGVIHDKLFVLPRGDSDVTMKDEQGRDIGTVQLHWSATAGQEWANDFASYKNKSTIDVNAEFADWMPTTLPNRSGLFFRSVNDGESLLTDKAGKPINWRPMTAAERQEKAAGELREQARKAATLDSFRVRERKFEQMKFIVENRELRSQGKRYDRRIDAFDGSVTDEHVHWFMNQRDELYSRGPFGVLPTIPASIIAQDKGRAYQPGSEPPLLEIPK